MMPSAACDSVEIRVDTPEGSTRRYHRVVAQIPVPARPDSLETLRIVLVPTRWAIQGGTYAGTVIPIDVDAAVAPRNERARYWRISRSAYGSGIPVAWPEARIPIPVAVHGRFGSLRPSDSTAFWRIARQLEADFGRTLFRPSPFDPTREEAWSITVTVDPTSDTPGITFITHDALGTLYEATVGIRSSILLRDERIVTHELVHALGFGHSVGWYSVMGSPSQAPSGATAADVAYAQLLYRLRRVHTEQRATHGILESLTQARGRELASIPRAVCAAPGPA
jgi:hypothetical protein